MPVTGRPVGTARKRFPGYEYPVIVILGDRIEQAQKYAADLHLPFPVLADPEREVYHRYDLQKSLFLIQRTAAILIDREGVIQFVKAVTNPLTWLVEYEELAQEAQRVHTLKSE